MVALKENTELGEALTRLAGALESLEFGPDAAAISADRDRLAGMVRSYLIPRLGDPSWPMAVVLAGPTGSGKSTLINSLSGLEVSPTGALRPTTRTPIVLATPGHADRFQNVGGVPCEVVTGEARILDSIVLVDTPDLDSTSTGHRILSETLIDNADIVVFVTSALRYADDIPWQVLRRAVSRGTPVIHVLNRVGSAGSGSIVDFRSRLAAAGLDDELTTVSEYHLSDGAQQVPSLAVRTLRNRIGDLVGHRAEFTARVVDRVLGSSLAQVSSLLLSMSDLDSDYEALQAELSRDLAGRIQRLDLAGVGQGLYPPPPERPSSRVVRHWRRTMGRMPTQSIAAAESGLVRRIAAMVDADIRKWLSEDPRLGDVVAEVMPAVRTIATTAAQGWVGFVARIAASHDDDDVWAYQSLLIDAATSGQAVPPVTNVVLGDEGPALIARARRELMGRLEVVYAQTANRVVDAMRARYGDFDYTELTYALGAVMEARAPAHA